MFHKLLHIRPEPLSECLFQYGSATSARSRRKPFQQPLPTHTHQHATENLFFYRSALPWNSLPHDIQSLKNSNHFAMLSRAATNNINLPHKKRSHTTLLCHFLAFRWYVHIHPDCVTSHATIFLQPLDGDPSIRVLPSLGILKI